MYQIDYDVVVVVMMLMVVVQTSSFSFCVEYYDVRSFCIRRQSLLFFGGSNGVNCDLFSTIGDLSTMRGCHGDVAQPVMRVDVSII